MTEWSGRDPGKRNSSGWGSKNGGGAGDWETDCNCFLCFLQAWKSFSCSIKQWAEKGETTHFFSTHTHRTIPSLSISNHHISYIFCLSLCIDHVCVCCLYYCVLCLVLFCFMCMHCIPWELGEWGKGRGTGTGGNRTEGRRGNKPQPACPACLPFFLPALCFPPACLPALPPFLPSSKPCPVTCDWACYITLTWLVALLCCDRGGLLPSLEQKKRPSPSFYHLALYFPFSSFSVYIWCVCVVTCVCGIVFSAAVDRWSFSHAIPYLLTITPCRVHFHASVSAACCWALLTTFYSTSFSARLLFYSYLDCFSRPFSTRTLHCICCDRFSCLFYLLT